MGLLTKLLTFPVSGPWWVVERIAEQAERELYDEEAIRRQLAELELRHDMGELDEEQLERAEDVLLDRLRVARARAAGAPLAAPEQPEDGR